MNLRVLVQNNDFEYHSWFSYLTWGDTNILDKAFIGNISWFLHGKYF